MAIRENDKYYTELDETLRNLAATDWPAFVQLVGEDNITAAKVCVLRSRGNTLGQIASKFSKKRSGVQYTIENKCRCDAGSGN